MNSKPTLLVVADDTLSLPLCAYLARFRFDACAVRDADGVRAQLVARRIALVVVDLMLPGLDGLALTCELRASSTTPVILLSVPPTGGGSAPPALEPDAASAADRIVALEMGADDCLARPFVWRELVARIQTVLRRVGSPPPAPPASSDVIRFDGWQLQRSERRLRTPAGQEVPLSNAEFQLLFTFLQTPRCVVSRDQLMARARGREMAGMERSIDLLVSRLRQKLVDDDDEAALIRTVRGVGYLFNAMSVEGLA